MCFCIGEFEKHEVKYLVKFKYSFTQFILCSPSKACFRLIYCTKSQKLLSFFNLKNNRKSLCWRSFPLNDCQLQWPKSLLPIYHRIYQEKQIKQKLPSSNYDNFNFHSCQEFTRVLNILFRLSVFCIWSKLRLL